MTAARRDGYEGAAVVSSSPTSNAVALVERSLWSEIRSLFVRHAERFVNSTLYEEGSAIADQAAREIDDLQADLIQSQAARIAELEGESVERVFEHLEPEDGDWSGYTPKEIADLAVEGWESGVETLYEDADQLDRKGQPGTGGRVRFAANFIRRALSLRQARSLLSEEVRGDYAQERSVPSVSDDRPASQKGAGHER